MRSLFKVVSLLSFAFVLPAVSTTAFSQTTTGRILGTVRDPSGAALAGVTVTVIDVQRTTTRTAATDDSGAYLFPNLIPGTYTIRAEARGFKALERPKLEVEVATDLNLDLSLTPGDVKETVVVTAEVPLLNTTSSTLGGTLSNKEIN